MSSASSQGSSSGQINDTLDAAGDMLNDPSASDASETIPLADAPVGLEPNRAASIAAKSARSEKSQRSLLPRPPVPDRSPYPPCLMSDERKEARRQERARLAEEKRAKAAVDSAADNASELTSPDSVPKFTLIVWNDKVEFDREDDPDVVEANVEEGLKGLLASHKVELPHVAHTQLAQAPKKKPQKRHQKRKGARLRRRRKPILTRLARATRKSVKKLWRTVISALRKSRRQPFFQPPPDGYRKPNLTAEQAVELSQVRARFSQLAAWQRSRLRVSRGLRKHAFHWRVRELREIPDYFPVLDDPVPFVPMDAPDRGAALLAVRRRLCDAAIVAEYTALHRGEHFCSPRMLEGRSRLDTANLGRLASAVAIDRSRDRTLAGCCGIKVHRRRTQVLPEELRSEPQWRSGYALTKKLPASSRMQFSIDADAPVSRGAMPQQSPRMLSSGQASPARRTEKARKSPKWQKNKKKKLSQEQSLHNHEVNYVDDGVVFLASDDEGTDVGQPLIDVPLPDLDGGSAAEVKDVISAVHQATSPYGFSLRQGPSVETLRKHVQHRSVKIIYDELEMVALPAGAEAAVERARYLAFELSRDAQTGAFEAYCWNSEL